MCSSTRGPASAPSLVTWPTRKQAAPFCLLNATSFAADSRTCPIEPAAEASSPLVTVWIESTAMTSGASSSATSRIRSSEVSQRIDAFESPTPSRSPRMRICCADSSPET